MASAPLIVLIPDVARKHLNDALPATASVQFHATFEGLFRDVRTAPGSVVVIDPSVTFSHTLVAIADAANAAGAYIVLYVSPTATCAARILDLVQRAPAEVLFWHSPVTREVLRGLLAREPSASALLLRKLSPHFARLPLTMSRASVALFGWLPIPTVADFCGLCAPYRRATERAFARAEFPSVANLIDAARLVRTWDRHFNSKSSMASRSVNDIPARTLHTHYLRFTGYSFRRAQTLLSTEDFVGRIAARVTAKP